jgi:hypothetical protein
MDWTLIFSSPEDAMEIGYEIGCNLRHAGATKSTENRKLGNWAGDNVANSSFVFWQIGFRAGFRSAPKPDFALCGVRQIPC